MKGLSPRQRAVLHVIVACQRRNGWTPSVREIGAALGLRSAATVQQHLRALEHKGYIRRPVGPGGVEGLPRVITVLRPEAVDAAEAVGNG